MKRAYIFTSVYKETLAKNFLINCDMGHEKNLLSLENSRLQNILEILLKHW